MSAMNANSFAVITRTVAKVLGFRAQDILTRIELADQVFGRPKHISEFQNTVYPKGILPKGAGEIS
jgi:hypothetical protein